MNDAKIIELLANKNIKVTFTHYRVPETEFEEAINGSPRNHKFYIKRYSRKVGFGIIKFSNYKKVRPATKGGCTSCVISLRRRTFSGFGNCSFEDTFCYAEGRKYAFDRAFKKFIDYIIQMEEFYA